MAKETNSQKKTTKSTKKAPAKNSKTTKNTNKNNSSAKKNNNVKKVTTKKVEKSKSVETVTKNETKPVASTSTKKVSKRNFITKAKNFIQKNWEEKREFSISCIVILVLLLIIIVLAVSKHIPKLKNGSEVIASIDGLSITSDDLYLDLKDSYGTNQLINLIDEKIADDYVKEFTDEDNDYVKQVLDYYKQYADYYGVSFEDFLSQYVGISNISTEDEFKEYIKKDYKKTLAVQKYVGSKINEDELKKEFEKNYKEKLTVRHILIEVNDDTTEEEAKKQAEDLIKELDKVKDDSKKLEEKFKDLAYDNSADQATYKDGGLYENFSKGEVDENFYNAAKKLKKGSYTAEPVKSEYGYHVILKISSKTNKYKDMKEEIRTNLAKDKLNNDSTLQVKSWDELRKKYNLKLNDTNIKKEYKNTISNASKDTNNKDNSDTDDNKDNTNTDTNSSSKE